MQRLRFTLAIIFNISLSINVFAHENLVIVGEEFPPYKYIDRGVVTGIDIEVAEHIFSRLGIRTEFNICPWNRCWYKLENGRADVGLSVSNQMDRSESVYFPETAVWTASFVAFTNKSVKKKYQINSLDDIVKNNLKVGVVNGNSYFPAFWEVFPAPRNGQKYHPQLDPATTAAQNFKKLAAERIDIYIVPETIGLYMINIMELDSEIVKYDTVFFSKDYPTVFSKKSGFSNRRYRDITELMKDYERELKIFKETEEFKNIFRKYLFYD